MQLNALSSFEDLLGAIDVLCIPASKDMLDDIHRNVLSLLIPTETLPPASELNIQNNSIVLFYGQWKGRRVKILLSYSGEQMTESSAYAVSKRLSIRARTENAERIGFMLNHISDPQIIVSAFTGWTAGQYDLGMYKNNPEENSKKSFDTVYSFLFDQLKSAAEDGITIGLVQHEVMNLVNTPASHKSPAALGEWANASAQRHNYTSTILNKEQLFQMGMHALLAVNRGSEHPAGCIVTHYKHPDASK